MALERGKHFDAFMQNRVRPKPKVDEVLHYLDWASNRLSQPRKRFHQSTWDAFIDCIAVLRRRYGTLRSNLAPSRGD
jgi:hypothetical protein